MNLIIHCNKTQGIIISLLNRSAKLITDSKDFKEEKEMLRRRVVGRLWTTATQIGL